jgi:hypothetical protein
MKLAIMQPYFLPHLGYYQLMAAVDKFVLYDDVNFIKGGWINRNRILLRGRAHFITVPLLGASPNKKINGILLAPRPHWREKMLRTITQAYRAAPYFDKMFPLLRAVIEFPAERLADFLFHSLVRLKEHLNVGAELVASSSRYGNENRKGAERVLDICRKEDAHIYVNAPGGRALYDAGTFSRRDLQLRFLESEAVEYSQGGETFSPSLSIVDVLMFNSPAEVQSLLGRYGLRA